MRPDYRLIKVPLEIIFPYPFIIPASLPEGEYFKTEGVINVLGYLLHCDHKKFGVNFFCIGIFRPAVYVRS